MSRATRRIDCPTDCSQSRVRGTQLILTAADTDDSIFTGWSGACRHGLLRGDAHAATNVQANFAPAFVLTSEIAAEAVQNLPLPGCQSLCSITFDASHAQGDLVIDNVGDCHLAPAGTIDTHDNFTTCRWKVLDGTYIHAAAQGEPEVLDLGRDCAGTRNECDLGPRSTTTHITVSFRLPLT